MAEAAIVTAPKRSVAIAKKGESRALALFDAPLTGITPALTIGNACRKIHIPALPALNARGDGYDVRDAKKIRDQHIATFAPADRSATVLYHALTCELDRNMASAMVGTLLAGFRTKPDKGALAAVLDTLESDEIARVSGLWEPLHATPATLALACRKLIATATFAPQPAELRAAVREARNHLQWAMEACERVVDCVHIADAVMLEFAPREEWIAPWQALTQGRAALERMLVLHRTYGDSHHRECYDDEDESTAFGALVEREKAALAALSAPVERKRIAAAKKRSEAKRSARKTEP